MKKQRGSSNVEVVMSYAAIIVFLFFVFNIKDCKADEWEGGVIIGSWHHDREAGYNENNEGLVLQYDFGEYRIGGMTFVNSYDDQATTLFLGTDYYESKYLDLGFNMNVVTGYHNMEDFTPVPILTATIKPFTNRYAPTINLQGIPGVVYGFGLGWDL